MWIFFVFHDGTIYIISTVNAFLFRIVYQDFVFIKCFLAADIILSPSKTCQLYTQVYMFRMLWWFCFLSVSARNYWGIFTVNKFLQGILKMTRKPKSVILNRRVTALVLFDFTYFAYYCILSEHCILWDMNVFSMVTF